MSAVPEVGERLLTVQELADYLQVSVSTVYDWRLHKTGPVGVRVGRYVRFSWSDVQAWVAQQREVAS